LFDPHEFWQSVHAAGAFQQPRGGYRDHYPASLPDGRQVALPLRVLPGDGTAAVASLIVNQASFAVEDALADAMAALAKPFGAEVVVGVPTLGLPLASGVARRLGHPRMVALGTSRKFWYQDELSEPLSSITSPDQAKRIYLDPRMLPLLQGRRVIAVDDVVSTGASFAAVLRLLRKAGIEPVAAVFAMKQGRRWESALADAFPAGRILAALQSPRFTRTADGLWRPDA
jgi:adenine/guanine phosphoribosyltransferase-like PRPP-binding protein